MLQMIKIHTFTGEHGVEAELTRNFADTCLILEKEGHVNPEQFSIIKWNRAINQLEEKAKAFKKANKK